MFSTLQQFSLASNSNGSSQEVMRMNKVVTIGCARFLQSAKCGSTSSISAANSCQQLHEQSRTCVSSSGPRIWIWQRAQDGQKLVSMERSMSKRKSNHVKLCQTQITLSLEDSKFTCEILLGSFHWHLHLGQLTGTASYGILIWNPCWNLLRELVSRSFIWNVLKETSSATVCWKGYRTFICNILQPLFGTLRISPYSLRVCAQNHPKTHKIVETFSWLKRWSIDKSKELGLGTI